MTEIGYSHWYHAPAHHHATHTALRLVCMVAHGSQWRSAVVATREESHSVGSTPMSRNQTRFATLVMWPLNQQQTSFPPFQIRIECKLQNSLVFGGKPLICRGVPSSRLAWSPKTSQNTIFRRKRPPVLFDLVSCGFAGPPGQSDRIVPHLEAAGAAQGR